MAIRSYLPIASLVAVGLVATGAITSSTASDHADTPQIAASPGTDITDVFMFPSPENPDRVVMIMTVNPLIQSGAVATAKFDPNVLYQFKIDNSGDNVEDVVMQFSFVDGKAGEPQNVVFSGAVAPIATGSASRRVGNVVPIGKTNAVIAAGTDVRVFAGVREDPFFFDLEQFFAILPDRATPLNGIPVPENQANTPQQGSWRAPGAAVDFLSNGNYNLLAIVVEVPKSSVSGASGNIGLWTTTSVPR